MKFWIQEWEESERGWGVRPDGFTAHREKEDIKKYLDEMRAREKKQYGDEVPDSYSRTVGEPFEDELPKSLADGIKGSGAWLPSDWKPSKEADKTRSGGWRANL